MKTILLVFLTQCTTSLIAQQPLVDPGSNTLSIAHTIEYAKLKDSESKITSSSRNLKYEIKKRLPYLLGGGLSSNLITIKINNKIREISRRLLYLKERNLRLNSFFYSNKKQRGKEINLIEKQIYFLKNGFSKNAPLSVTTLHGEEMNFYHDVIRSLNILEKQIDNIASDLDNSELNLRLLKK